MIEKLKLKDLKATVKNQTREEINPEALADYKEAIKTAKAKGADIPFPPLVAYKDFEGNIWLSDGFTRRQALLANGIEDYDVEVREGEKRDAIKNGFLANREHGVRLTNADKKHNLLLALEDKEWAELSNNALAELVGVSESFVRTNRPAAKSPETVKSKKGKAVKKGNIGKKGGSTRKKAAAAKKGKKGKGEDAAPDAGGGDATPEPPKGDAELDKALAKISGAINGNGFDGAQFVAGVKDGSLPLSTAEVKKFAATSDERIRHLAPLVINQRWSVAKATAFLDKEPTADTKADHFINLAVAHGGLVREKVNGAGCVWFIAEDYTIGETKEGVVTITPKKKKK